MRIVAVTLEFVMTRRGPYAIRHDYQGRLELGRLLAPRRELLRHVLARRRARLVAATAGRGEGEGGGDADVRDDKDVGCRRGARDRQAPAGEEDARGRRKSRRPPPAERGRDGKGGVEEDSSAAVREAKMNQKDARHCAVTHNCRAQSRRPTTSRRRRA